MAVKINRSLTLFSGKVFDLVREDVILENGTSVNVDIIRHPGASAVVPIIEENTLLFIKQYRHALGEYIWEIPAGTFEDNENPLECAKRELIEETGFAAQKWIEMGKITPLPGYSDEVIHLFLATSLEAKGQDLDSDEMLKVHRVTLDVAIDMIYKAEIQDGKTIAAVFKAASHLKRQNTPIHNDLS